MRRRELISTISTQTGIPKTEVSALLESFFLEVKAAVTRGETVSLRTFGSFTVKKRAGRQGRNISMNENIFVEERYVPKFIPSREFMEALKSIPIRY